MVAAGGSFLTLGWMMLCGVDPSMANGTNRIGVIFGTGSGMMAYRAEKLKDFKQSLYFALCAIPGAIIGSYYSIKMDGELFKQVLAVIMILVLITMFLPKSVLTPAEGKLRKSIFIYPAMFAIGFYGGFIQVGVGFLLIAALRFLTDYTLLQVNMHKVSTVFLYTLPAVAVFGISGEINWLYAIVMSAGNALGAWLSVKIAVRKGEGFIKIMLGVAMVIMAVKFLLT